MIIIHVPFISHAFPSSFIDHFIAYWLSHLSNIGGTLSNILNSIFVQFTFCLFRLFHLIQNQMEGKERIKPNAGKIF